MPSTTLPNDASKQAIAFLDKVSSDYKLRDRISTANNDDDLVRITKEAGFNPSAEDIWLHEDRSFKRKAGLRGWYFHSLESN